MGGRKPSAQEQIEQQNLQKEEAQQKQEQKQELTEAQKRREALLRRQLGGAGSLIPPATSGSTLGG